MLFVIYERELESFESLIVLIRKYPFTNMDHTKMLELKIQVQNDENNINKTTGDFVFHHSSYCLFSQEKYFEL